MAFVRFEVFEAISILPQYSLNTESLTVELKAQKLPHVEPQAQ